MDDREIVDLFLARDERAIKETEIKYGKLCYGIAYNILQNNQDAEECVNDTFLGVWNSIPPTLPDNLTGYVCKIARNQSLKRLESKSAVKRLGNAPVSFDELEEILVDDNVSLETSDEEIGNAISRFLRNQSESVRNVFIRKYYFCDSIEEISKNYGFSESKIKNMLYHTRIKLKAYLIKEGIEV